jgi:hypothetical protein
MRNNDTFGCNNESFRWRSPLLSTDVFGGFPGPKKPRDTIDLETPLPVSEIFRPEALDKLKIDEKPVTMNSGDTASFGKKYDVYRLWEPFTNADRTGINFTLADNQTTIKRIMIVEGPDRTENAIINKILDNPDLFKDDALAKLGFSKNSVQAAKEARLAETRISDEMAARDFDDVSRLPNTYELRELPIGIMQGEAVILNASSKETWAYTFGTNPCGILGVVSKNKADGKVLDVALAHIDATVSEQDVVNLLQRLSMGEAPLDIYIIGGIRSIARNIFKATKRVSYAKIVFMCSRSDGSMVADAAGIDVSGKVYYGDRGELNMNKQIFDPKKLDVIALQRAFGGLMIKDMRIRLDDSKKLIKPAKELLKKPVQKNQNKLKL